MIDRPAGASPSRSWRSWCGGSRRRLARGRAPASPSSARSVAGTSRTCAASSSAASRSRARTSPTSPRASRRRATSSCAARPYRSIEAAPALVLYAAAARPLRARRAHAGRVQRRAHPAARTRSRSTSWRIVLGELPPRDRRAARDLRRGRAQHAGVRGPGGARLDAAAESRGRHARLDRAARARRVDRRPPAPPPPRPPAPRSRFRGGAISESQVVAAIRECYDPEIPINVYDLGLIYGIDIDEAQIAIRMTLTSEGCPSARQIPEDVKRRVVGARAAERVGRRGLRSALASHAHQRGRQGEARARVAP